jgi:phage repressor protein C with HTH and peptisase S24 domain
MLMRLSARPASRLPSRKTSVDTVERERFVAAPKASATARRSEIMSMGAIIGIKTDLSSGFDTVFGSGAAASRSRYQNRDTDRALENHVTRVIERIEEAGINIATAGRFAGEASLIRNWERAWLGRRHLIEPRITTLAKLAVLLQCSEDWLLHGRPADRPPPIDRQQLAEMLAASNITPKRSLKSSGVATLAEPPPREALRSDEIAILGTAAGASVGSFAIDQAVETIECPPALRNVVGAYALRVRGVSMIPAYPEGEIVFVHPYLPYRADDPIIIQTENYTNAGREAFLKYFKRATKEDLICSQLNPPGVVWTQKMITVASVHRVLRTHELFGR